jgi:FkbM family methyltransferase
LRYKLRLIKKLIKAGCTLSALDAQWLRALLHGVAPSLEHLNMLRCLQPSLVVDIGANRGQFALAARHCFPEARIVSFEPLPGPASIFRRVFAGDARVTLHESAIGSEAGSATIHVSESDDSSSLLPITAKQNALFPGTSEAGTQVIRVVHLEDCLGPKELQAPSLLKLDVQGFELSTLQGCETLLHEFSWVYAECSFVELYEGQALADEIIAWLRDRGFKLSGVYNMSYDPEGRAIQADFLFRRDGVGVAA